MTRKPSEVLIMAAEIMQQNGWHRGYYFKSVAGHATRRSPCCVLGAVGIAVCGNPVRPSGLTVASAGGFLRRILGQCPASWNDRVCRSKHQAVAALVAAAHLATSEGQ